MIPQRPVFSDGAVLGAADLTALGQLDRDRDGRHARHLHTPGVASGLQLTETPGPVPPGIEVTLQPGYAVDGTGRELIVAAAVPVSADSFVAEITQPITQENSSTTVWYPVFIRGLDASVAATNGQLGCQGSAAPTRIEEDVELEFGRPGDATAEQAVPAPDAGPGDGAWRILVGFVQLDTNKGHFVGVAQTADGVRVQAAGVRAGLVAGPSGRVEIRTDAAASNKTPAVVIESDGSLVFGLHNGTGDVSKLMSVDSSGNLTVTGTVKDALKGAKAGMVFVASGTASDGAIVPLPAQADPAAIAAKRQHVSILVTPRLPDPDSAPANLTRFLPAECRVDDDRRVHSWGTWFKPGAATTPEHASTGCDFLVLVTVDEGAA
jgi:hypothetical protein